MEFHISATQAARRFSDLISRVLYRHEEFVIERGGEPVCRLMPAQKAKLTGADLKKLLHAIPKPDVGYWDTLHEISTHQPESPPPPWPS